MDEDPPSSSLTPVEQSGISAKAIEVCECQNTVDLQLIKSIRLFRRSLGRSGEQGMNQSTIDTFFKN